MTDSEIIDLYWKRSETAIRQTAIKFSGYCFTVSFNILHDEEDSYECVNDTYLRAWDAMPPARPDRLAAFLGRITRNLALDRYKISNAQKRNSGQIDLALSELENCIPDSSNIDNEMAEKELKQIINSFLETLSRGKRRMFVQRYWYFMSIKEIADQSGKSESNVKSTLFRVRNRLKNVLMKEGVTI